MAVPRVRDLKAAAAAARVRWHPLGLRLQVLAVLAIAVGAFSLPFVTVSEELVARATGFELVRDDPELSGRYVHEQYRGEVEAIVGNGHVPALLALALAGVGLAATLVPGPGGLWAAALASGAGFLTALALSQTTSSQFVASMRHAGWWLLLLCFALAAVRAASAARRGPPGADVPQRWRYERR